MAEEKYPFLEFLLEDKSHYPLAREMGYVDPWDNFRIGDSGGFLMNIRPGKFINTNLFAEMANRYIEDGTYTHYKIDSVPFRQLRKREARRRAYGMEAPCWLNPDGSISDVHISGDYYNFLNYTRMKMVDDSTIQGTNKVTTASKMFSFPKFIDAQYWTHACLEFAENNGFHIIIVKTRRGGFSYLMAARGANRVNLRKHTVFINVAADSKYLTQKGGLTDFATNSLKFYEESGLFKRGIFSPTITDFRLGYRLKSGVEADDSWQSSLLSVSANNNPDCAIGKDAVGVNVEELSTMQNFDEFMTVTEPAMTVGDITTGMLCAWGTATATNMQIFEQNFYNPKAFNFMPFEDVWDRDSRNEVCGFFKSFAWGVEGFYNGVAGVDKDGNSNLEIGLEIAKRGRERKKETAKSYADYLKYIGQRAIFPAESFSSAIENIFIGEEFNKWEERLRVDNSFKFYVDGQTFYNNGSVNFKSNQRIKKEDENAKIYDWIVGVPRRSNEDPHGCVRVWFPPEYDEYYVNDRKVREIPAGTYVAIYDPVGVNKEKKEITSKHSHNAMYVFEMPNERNGYKIKLCAAYFGRPDKLEEADYEFYKLCIWYNCVGTGIVEVNRGETVSNFKKWKALRYLAHEPLYVWDANIKEKVSSTYGYVITEGQRKLDAIRLFKEFLWTEIAKDELGNTIYNFNRIIDYQSILEIKKWNSEGNFDRVSALLLLGIYWKSIDIKSKNEIKTRKHYSEIDEREIMARPWF